MLCKVRFTAVDPEEDFGKYAMQVTESESGIVWKEIRFESDEMLGRQLRRFKATEAQTKHVLEHLIWKSAVVKTELEIPDEEVDLLREVEPKFSRVIH